MTTDQKKQLSITDPILGKIMDVLNEPRVVSTKNVFHDLLSCVLEQQIHYRSTKQIFKKCSEEPK